MVDDADLEWLKQYSWYTFERKSTSYAVHGDRNSRPFTTYMHRLILNAPRELMVDHIDRNGLNNQRSNLRLCSRSQNGRNRAPNINNKSGLKGIIRLANGSWAVKIHIGTFETKDAAIIAYNEAAQKYHGEFAYLNGKS